MATIICLLSIYYILYIYSVDKGVLAWESHTSTWLVSLAAGCEKIK